MVHHISLSMVVWLEEAKDGVSLKNDSANSNHELEVGSSCGLCLQK